MWGTCAPSLTVCRVPRLYLTTVELMPPHRPLSDVTGTTMFFSTSAPASHPHSAGGAEGASRLQATCSPWTASKPQSAPGWSPNNDTNGSTSPRDFSVSCCATLILEAATIFMALVIFWMFLTERIRCFTAHRASGVSQAGLADPWLAPLCAQQ